MLVGDNTPTQDCGQLTGANEPFGAQSEAPFGTAAPIREARWTYLPWVQFLIILLDVHRLDVLHEIALARRLGPPIAIVVCCSKASTFPVPRERVRVGKGTWKGRVV